eukprot:5888384-Pleurochrysis_carterae.AAC.1
MLNPSSVWILRVCLSRLRQLILRFHLAPPPLRARRSPLAQSRALARVSRGLRFSHNLPPCPHRQGRSPDREDLWTFAIDATFVHLDFCLLKANGSMMSARK